MKRKASKIVAIATALTAANAFAVTKDWNVSGGSWNTSGNWLPNGTPGGLDTVFIGSTAAAANGTVMLNVSPSVAGLTVTDGMTIDTSNQSLLVGTTTNVSGANTVGSTTFNSRLMIRSNAGSFSFKTLNNLNLQSGARVDMAAGKLEVGSLLFVDGTSTLAGTGTINLTSNAATALSLDGNLSVGVGSLTINQNGSGRVDLDGGSILDRRIDVTAGNNLTHQYAVLTINGEGLADTYDDSLRIGGRNTVNMNLTNGWTMSSGTLEFADNTLDPGWAVLNGSTLTFNGNINVIGFNSRGEIGSAITINPFARVNVNPGNELRLDFEPTVNGGTFTVGQGGTITFASHTKVNGGTFTTPSNNSSDGVVRFAAGTEYAGTITFNGSAQQVGDASVGTATVINAGAFDMDGNGGAHWSIGSGLTINAGTIEDASDPYPAFDGTIDIYNGGLLSSSYLKMNLPIGDSWTMNGQLNLHGASFGLMASAIGGSHVIVTGDVNVEGGNSIQSRVSFESGSVTDISAGAALQLEGAGSIAPNMIHGGLIQGNGYLQATSGHPLIGSGTINANLYFEPGADLYAYQGTLTIGGGIAQMGHIGTLDPTATLNVVNPWDTTVTQSLVLNGGTVTGGTITNGTLTYGNGTIKSAGFINNGYLQTYDTDVLTVDTVNAPDLDGTTNQGNLYVSGDTLRIVKAPTDAFDGQADIIYLSTLQLDNGWTLGSAGTLNFIGQGNYPATVKGSSQLVLGHVNVNNCQGVFDIASTIAGNAKISIPTNTDQLTLKKDTIIGSTVSITGNGTLRVDPGATLTPANNAGINVYLENAGKIAIAGAATAGTVGSKMFTQLSSGELDIDLGGPTAGTQFDRLVVTSNTSLDGGLALAVMNNYNPAYLTSHEVLHSGGAMTGKFKQIIGLALSPTKYLAVTYDADSVLVTAAMPGDANLDGSVNISDFSILASKFNTQGSWATGDFTGDGVTNIGDFSLLGTNFNTHVPGDLPRLGLVQTPRGNAVPEPACLFAALAMLATRSRKR